MAKEKTLQSEIGGYLSTLLRTHFGKGPTSIYVTIAGLFITVHFRGFLSPMEKILVKQHEEKRVLGTRDLMMNDIKSEIVLDFIKKFGISIKEFYADWNLENETGMFIGVVEEKANGEVLDWPESVDEKEFRDRIIEASYKAEKVPGSTEVYWLSDRTILIRRSEILVQIEKELIKNGFLEELKLAKRPLEHKVLEEVQLETVLKRAISEAFLDWHFDKDLGYIVLLLEPEPHDRKG
jgi:uncharacterized protein YbcI